MMMMNDMHNAPQLYVCHPLDVPMDQLEHKRDVSSLGPMQLTPTVQYALLSLRVYLIVMGLLCLYHILVLSHFFK